MFFKNYKERNSNINSGENSEDEDDLENASAILSDSGFANYNNENVVPKKLASRSMKFQNEIIHGKRTCYEKLVFDQINETISVGDFVKVYSRGNGSKVIFISGNLFGTLR